MRYLPNGFPGSCRFILVTVAVLALSATVAAEEPEYGTMAAAIRSANFPCAHVQSVSGAGSNAWIVQCNSGKFRVTRDGEGNYSVSQAD